MLKYDIRLVKILKDKNLDDILNKIKHQERARKWKYIPQIIVSGVVLSVFVLGMIFGKSSNLEKEIEDCGKSAQECLVNIDSSKIDTLEAVKYIEKGTKKAKSAGEYKLFKKYILPSIEQIYESDFYDKEDGALIFGPIRVNKPAGTVKYPRRYKPGKDWFPKENR